MRISTIARLQGSCLRHCTAPISTSSLLCAGSKWRLKQGLGKCGNEYGPLTDISDWSYADGRPAPLWPSEIKRREKQKQLAGQAIELISELKFAKKHYREKKTSSKNRDSSEGTFKKSS